MEKLKVSAAVVSLFAAGALFGGVLTFEQIRYSGLEASVRQLAQSHQILLDDLNKKILPEIQRQLEALKPTPKK